MLSPCLQCQFTERLPDAVLHKHNSNIMVKDFIHALCNGHISGLADYLHKDFVVDLFTFHLYRQANNS